MYYHYNIIEKKKMKKENCFNNKKYEKYCDHIACSCTLYLHCNIILDNHDEHLILIFDKCGYKTYQIAW